MYDELKDQQATSATQRPQAEIQELTAPAPQPTNMASNEDQNSDLSCPKKRPDLRPFSAS